MPTTNDYLKYAETAWAAYTTNLIHTDVGDSGLFRWDVNQDAQGTLQLAGFVAANQEKFSCAA